MKRQFISVFYVGLALAVGLCLVAGTASANDIAWDMVSSTSQNLISYSTDAPVFSSPGDGFQKYTVGVSASIPYGLVDDTNNGYAADAVGVIDSATDFDEFFGIIDTTNNDNPNSDYYHATWVFDISSATGNLGLWVDLGAMGDFEDTDFYEWSYQVDSGPVTPVLSAVANVDGALTYTMADGTTRDLDDPLVVDSVTLSNQLQTLVAPITGTGSQLTITLTALTDGGSEGYAAKNLIIKGDVQGGDGGGEPIPTLSLGGMLSMLVLLLVCGMFLIRRLY